MNALVKDITDTNFDQELGPAAPLTLLDFTASWCAPCKQLAPLVDELARLYAGRLLVAKIDIDASAGLKDRFAIRSVPTLILFKEGKELSRLQHRTKTRLIAAIDDHLK